MRQKWRTRFFYKEKRARKYAPFFGATGRTWTGGLLITNQLLYRLSHSSIASYYIGFRVECQQIFPKGLCWNYQKIYFLVLTNRCKWSNILRRLKLRPMEKSRSWPSAHDWKSCIPQKGIEGSNPSFSAKTESCQDTNLCPDMVLFYWFYGYFEIQYSYRRTDR